MTIKVFHRGAASAAVEKFVPELVADQVASLLFQKDHTLWGLEAESESAIRLGWVDAAKNSMELIPELTVLRKSLVESGLTRLVLCGMGGSSLAPEVIAKTHGVELLVLDATDPSQIRQALETDIETTVVVVSSKSGSTVETDSQKRSFEKAFSDAGIEKTERIFIVTDPESPMHQQAVADGYRVFLADPMVGGRYSALTAFGVVPSMLAGCDMLAVLQSAHSAVEILSRDDDTNPGLILGAAMARTKSNSGYRDKCGLVSNGGSIVGFGDWAEQLIAESTGKNGLGILPVVLGTTSPEVQDPPTDLLTVELSGDATDSSYDVAVSGDLGEQLLLWEVATVVAARLLGVNPFDQPDVESAKIAARALLDTPATTSAFAFEQDGVEVAALGFELSGRSLQEAIADFLSTVDSTGYLSIHCYLNRETLSQAATLREVLAQRTKRPTTFGWGPRFLHSTGQYHKGGPRQGFFLQLISGANDDQPIPGRDFGFRQLIDSQANGDAKVLASNGSPVLVLRLSDPERGIKLVHGLLS